MLVAEYGPDVLIPVDEVLATSADQEDKVPGVENAPDADASPDPRTLQPGKPFVRAEQETRLASAERKLGQLGRVNPLALEEFEALEQRHRFLTEQLADLTATRKDLLTIIDEIDEKMQDIFASAFEDTKAAFNQVFPVLFPGGSGSIHLTEPDNLLTTGIEVTVKPAGKKIERLSLLSGGERSLAAVALLIAIFKARPSPFYILDEVEAALDDANLGRLLTVLEDLREHSQLIVITHQKRTMEIADALYGVSMRQDGVSAVVGQRVGDRAFNKTARELTPPQYLGAVKRWVAAVVLAAIATIWMPAVAAQADQVDCADSLYGNNGYEFFEVEERFVPPPMRGTDWDCAVRVRDREFDETLLPGGRYERSVAYILLYVDMGYEQLVELYRSFERRGYAAGNEINIISTPGAPFESSALGAEDLATMDPAPELRQRPVQQRPGHNAGTLNRRGEHLRVHLDRRGHRPEPLRHSRPPTVVRERHPDRAVRQGDRSRRSEHAE